MLSVHPTENAFEAKLIGGTRDLNAGQIIDRVGVKMGFAFPCGAELERHALACDSAIPKKKISRDGLFVNLSGLENMALKLYSDTDDRGIVSKFVLDYVYRAIAEMSDEYLSRYGKTHFVYAGGVMSNSIIKSRLSERFECSFAEPAMSADNAVGIAYLALRADLKNNII